MQKEQPAIIYNLFPRLVGSMSVWHSHFERAHKMGFNWVYINPIQYPGFSGSLYSIKDYYKLNPMFANGNKMSEANQIRNMVHKAHLAGLKVMFDLVINHTAIDAGLIEQHPEWYKRGPRGAIKNPQVWEGDKLVCTWGDLAEIDNENSADKLGLWNYWLELIKYFIKLGVDGFRCDAAYQVPVDLWTFLISAAKKESKNLKFFAETLGCEIADVIKLANAGFDYTFNSSKWWNYKDEWCITQYEKNRQVSPSISFAESHDTERLAKETGGDVKIIKQKYLFSALFSTGVLMPIGFEYGFKTKLNVVNTTPDKWETSQVDLSKFIKACNLIKRRYKVFAQDNELRVIDFNNSRIFGFLKTSKDNKEKGLVIMNKDAHNNCQGYYDLPAILQASWAQITDISPEEREDALSENREFILKPSQTKVFIVQK